VYMCVNAPVSLASFVIGITSSIALIFYGAPKYARENLAAGLFFIYIAFVQLLEFFMWIDLDGKRGFNQIATSIISIYVRIQPLVLYAAEVFSFRKTDPFFNVAALVYLAKVAMESSPPQPFKCLTTVGKDGHLDWKWFTFDTTLIRHLPYNIMFVWAVIVFFSWRYALLFLVLGPATSLVTLKLFDMKSYGTMWCLLSAYIPIFMLVGGRYL